MVLEVYRMKTFFTVDGETEAFVAINGTWKTIDDKTIKGEGKIAEKGGHLGLAFKEFKEFSLRLEVKIEQGTPSFCIHSKINDNQQHYHPQLPVLTLGRWYQIFIEFKQNLYTVKIVEEDGAILGKSTIPLNKNWPGVGQISLNYTENSIVYFRHVFLETSQ
jgi:hypothetical protein